MLVIAAHKLSNYKISTTGVKIKSAIIDISRVLGIDPADVYAVTTSMIDVDESASLEELKRDHPKLNSFLKEYPEIEQHLIKILGSFRHYCLGENSVIRCSDYEIVKGEIVWIRQDKTNILDLHRTMRNITTLHHPLAESVFTEYSKPGKSLQTPYFSRIPAAAMAS